MHLFYMDVIRALSVGFHHYQKRRKKGFKLTRYFPLTLFDRLLLLTLCYNVTITFIVLGASLEHYNISYESLVLPQEVDICFQTVPDKTIQKFSRSLALAFALSRSPHLCPFTTLCVSLRNCWLHIRPGS